jgi:RimJ/RimL family protein N-acetyltransferase
MLASDRTRYMMGRLDRDQAWRKFCEDVAHWPLFGFGALTIVRTDSGEIVGEVAIIRGIDYPEDEIGWLLFNGQEGRGYATEAARALRDWAFGPRGLETLVSYIDPRNARSRAVAERLGGRLDAEAERPDPGDVVYRHRPEWAA